LEICGKVYGIVKNTTSIIMRELFSALETIGDS
jgi:hypothetical protein